MINISETVMISRPPSDVFAFIADLDNIAKWNTEVESFTISTSAPTRVGSQFVEHTRIGPGRTTVNCEVTEFSPDSRITFIGDSAPLYFEFMYSLEPAAGGTKVTLEGHVSPKRLMSLLAPLMAGEIKSGGRKGLMAIKANLEME